MVSLKSGPDGKRRRKKVSGRNKTEVRAKLAELHDELNDGVVSEAGYTVAQAIRDYLADGLPGRSPRRSERNGKSWSRCSRSSGTCRCAS